MWATARNWGLIMCAGEEDNEGWDGVVVVFVILAVGLLICIWMGA